MAAGEYTVEAEAQVIATAITILELTAPSTGMLEILRAWCSQSSSAASAQARLQILRKTATVTGAATPPTPRPMLPGYAASGMTVKWLATAEGTDGVILHDEGFNLINGFLWVPVPEERIWVPPSGIIALKFPAAPTSATWSFGFKVRERG